MFPKRSRKSPPGPFFLPLTGSDGGGLVLYPASNQPGTREQSLPQSHLKCDERGVCEANSIARSLSLPQSFPIKAFYKLGLTCLTAGLLLTRVSAQETLSSVQREMDRVDKEIEREKDLHKTERKRAADFENEKAAKLKALQDQLRLTQGKIDSLKHQLDRAKGQKAGFKAQTAQYQTRQKDFAKALTKQIRDLSLALKKDFPYNRDERVSQLEELANAIDNGVVPLEDGLNRFFVLSQASLDFAYDTEVYRGTYHGADGSDHEGSYVRLGAALLAFAGEDGKTAAYLAKADTGYAWREADLTPDTRQDIFTALKVAQGKVAPQLVNIPFQAPKPVEGAK